MGCTRSIQGHNLEEVSWAGRHWFWVSFLSLFFLLLGLYGSREGTLLCWTVGIECYWMCYRHPQFPFSLDWFYKILEWNALKTMVKLPLKSVLIPCFSLCHYSISYFIYNLCICCSIFARCASCTLSEPFLCIPPSPHPPIFLISSTCSPQLCLVPLSTPPVLKLCSQPWPGW